MAVGHLVNLTSTVALYFLHQVPGERAVAAQPRSVDPTQMDLVVRAGLHTALLQREQHPGSEDFRQLASSTYRFIAS